MLSSAPPYLLQQMGRYEQSEYLDPQHNDDYCNNHAAVLLNPAQDATQTAAQEDHTMGRELVQLLGTDSTLGVPHRSVL